MWGFGVLSFHLQVDELKDWSDRIKHLSCQRGWPNSLLKQADNGVLLKLEILITKFVN